MAEPWDRVCRRIESTLARLQEETPEAAGHGYLAEAEDWD